MKCYMQKSPCQYKIKYTWARKVNQDNYCVEVPVSYSKKDLILCIFIATSVNLNGKKYLFY